MNQERIIGVGQIGVGYWGKNLFRNFAALPHARVVQVCDASADVLARIEQQYDDV